MDAVQLVGVQYRVEDFMIGTDIALHSSFADWREQVATSRPVSGNRKKGECPAEIAAITPASGLGE